MTKVVNLFAGPGAGKSTTAFGLIHLLKAEGVSAEFVHEWIKHPVWQGRNDMPQYYVWAKQQKLLDGLYGKVEVIVTDSPTLLSLVYGAAEPEPFRELVRWKFVDDCGLEALPQLNWFIDREKPYFEGGRYQTEAEARELDDQIHQLLNSPLQAGVFKLPRIPHLHHIGNKEAPAAIARQVLSVL